MSNVKPWQIVVISAAVVAVGASAYFSLSSGPKLELANSIRMVDINTGELFSMTIGKGGTMIPGVNPKSKSTTLLPVVERDGKWFLSERYMRGITGIEGKHEAIVDPKTGEVRAKTE